MPFEGGGGEPFCLVTVIIKSVLGEGCWELGKQGWANRWGYVARRYGHMGKNAGRAKDVSKVTVSWWLKHLGGKGRNEV